MKSLTIALLVSGLALSAGASALASDDPVAPTATPKRACFYSHQVHGWREDRVSRHDAVYLNVGAHDVYRLEMLGPCIGIDDATMIGVETRSGMDTICDGVDVVVVTQGPMGEDRCHVSKITKLTPEERKALSAKRRP
ncbi:MAG: DUF6491 family protein [Caulobacter sp.]|nr:DUF6491 family protein [Caulobacter sp.]